MQESTGFSPAELVFGHTVHGPLRLLRDKFLSETASSSSNVFDYVSNFRERLHKACETACSTLAAAQGKMKNKFDKTSIKRNFQVGDKVLVLLPIPSFALQAKFCGRYVIEKKLSEVLLLLAPPIADAKLESATSIC